MAQRWQRSFHARMRICVLDKAQFHSHVQGLNGSTVAHSFGREYSRARPYVRHCPYGRNYTEQDLRGAARAYAPW
eukprot:2422923-Pleurochrysis_carterae.AAC.1